MLGSINGALPHPATVTTPVTPSPSGAARGVVPTVPTDVSQIRNTVVTSVPSFSSLLNSADASTLAKLHDPARLTDPPFAALRAAIEQALSQDSSVPAAVRRDPEVPE